MRFYFKPVLLTLFILGLSGVASAATTIGVLAGVTSLSNGGGTPFTYGADLESTGPIAVGLTYNTLTPNSTSISGTSYSQGLSNLYPHVEVMIGNLGLGVLGGISWWNNSSPGASNTTNFIYGLHAHWDWMVNSSLSVGPRVDFIWSNQSGAYMQTDIVGVLKLWL